MDKLKPIVSLESLENSFDIHLLSIPDDLIYVSTEDNKTYLNIGDNKVEVSKATLSDLIKSNDKVFDVQTLNYYLESLNVNKFLYINKLNGKLLSIYMRNVNNNWEVNLAYGSNSIKLSNNYSGYTSVINSFVNSLTQLLSDIDQNFSKNLDGYKCHQLREKSRVSDYIAFNTFKTQGKSKMILVSSSESVITFSNHNNDIGNVTYKQNDIDGYLNAVWLNNIYKEEKVYTQNITPDNYGSFIDLDIVYKLNGVKKLINVKLNLEENVTNVTPVIDETINDDIIPITYDGDECTYTDGIIDGIIGMIGKVSTMTEIFNIVSNFDRLVTYSMSDDISEFYISSCRIHKVVGDTQDGEGD